MDPWLEHPALWPDVHRNLISVCQELLTPLVAPHFYVRGEERVYLASGPRYIEPDVFVVVRRAQPMPAGVGEAAPEVERTIPHAPTVFPLTSFEDEVRERYLEIRERGTHRVVTVIEILSPANKIKGTPRYQQFIRKRTEVLNPVVSEACPEPGRRVEPSDAHWIEIDLLRAGTRWELVPWDSDYCVVLCRVERRETENPTGEAWLFNLPDPLPTIPVPLRPPHPDVALDLQQALNTVYDRAGYGVSVDYGQPAEPPLSPDMAAWAGALLKEMTQ
jgi:hypothetical protein